MQSQPQMWILQADPGKYIGIPSATLVAIWKVIEGIVAVLLCQPLVGLVREFVLSGAYREGVSVPLISLLPVEQVLRLLPAELLVQSGLDAQTLSETMFSSISPNLLGESELTAQSADPIPILTSVLSFLTVDVYTGSIVARGAVLLGVLALFVIFVGIAVEGLLLLVLRFRYAHCGGISGLVWVQRIIRYALIALLAAAAGFFLFHIYQCVTTRSLRMTVVFIPAGLVILMLGLTISYARSVYKTFAAIDFELRMEFKDTSVREIRLDRDAFCLGLLFLLATTAILMLAIKLGLPLASVRYGLIACAFMTVKYFTGMHWFGKFKWCHK